MNSSSQLTGMDIFADFYPEYIERLNGKIQRKNRIQGAICLITTKKYFEDAIFT
jgi:hypothetical protein